MYFFLEIDTDGPIRSDNLVRTHTRIGGHIASRIGNAHICRIVAH